MTEDGQPRTEDRGGRGKIRNTNPSTGSRQVSKYETNSNDQNSKIQNRKLATDFTELGGVVRLRC